MKIVRIIGGLGNQMFQYALALALKQQQKNEEVKLDLSAFRGYKKHGGFQLVQCFSTTLPAATWQEVAQLAWYYPHYQLWRIGHRVLPVRKTMLKEPFCLKPCKERVMLIMRAIGRMSAISATIARPSYKHSHFLHLQIHGT